jgi:hypothetical protein
MKMIVTTAPKAPFIPVIIRILLPLRPRAAYTVQNMGLANVIIERHPPTGWLEVRGNVDPGELGAHLYGHSGKRAPQHRFRGPQVGELSVG